MHHTAISQVIESFGKLIFGLVGAIYAINRNMSTEKVAAFAIFGITVGVGLSMVYLIIVKAFFDKNKIGSIKVMPYSNKTSIIKQLVRLALPITLSSSVLSIGGAIDTMLVPKSLAYCGFSASEANRMYSCYGNMAVPLFSLIPAFIAPIAMALVPMVSTHHNSNSIREEKIAICQSIKMTLFVAAPASLGLAFFAGPVLQMIFPTDINTIGIASSLLSILALSIVPACLITTTNAILQAQSHAQKTIFSMICGVLVKLVVEYFLIRQRDINIFGAPISTLACDITVISINFYYVIKYSPQLKELVRDCIGIVWTSILAMGGTVVIWYTTGMKDSGSNVATALAVFIAMVLYFGIAWLFGIVDSTISNVIPDFNNNLIKRKNKNEQRREDKVFTKQRAL